MDVRVLGKETKRVQLQSRGESVRIAVCCWPRLDQGCKYRVCPEVNGRVNHQAPRGRGRGQARSHVPGKWAVGPCWSTKMPLSLSQTLWKTGVVIQAFIHSSVLTGNPQLAQHCMSEWVLCSELLGQVKSIRRVVLWELPGEDSRKLLFTLQSPALVSPLS